MSPSVFLFFQNKMCCFFGQKIGKFFLMWYINKNVKKILECKFFLIFLTFWNFFQFFYHKIGKKEEEEKEPLLMSCSLKFTKHEIYLQQVSGEKFVYLVKNE
jgi:hypothetical protein